MNLELLKTFCSTELYHPTITSPFSSGDFTYATDGRILLRVPRVAEVQRVDDALAKRCDNIFTQWPSVGDWKPLPDPFTVLDPPRDCSKCDATGRHECTCGHEHPCGKCGGNGRIERELKSRVDFGKHALAGHYVQLSSTLPGVLMRESAGGGLDPVGLKFDGGDGVLMPLGV
jgi:hypothetical protein